MNKPRGMTLTEVAMTLVVLALLAAIAVPTFKRVLERGEGNTVAVQLGVLARDAAGIKAAASADYTWSQALERALENIDVANTEYELEEQGSGPLAASGYGHIVYKTDGGNVGLATVSPSGESCYARSYQTKISTWCADSGAIADGATALKGPEGTDSETFTALLAPQISNVEAGDETATVEFAAVTGATIYEAECAVGAAAGIRASGTPSSGPGAPISITVAGLKNGVQHSCRARAGGASSWSAWSAASPVTPVPPGNLPAPTISAAAKPGDVNSFTVTIAPVDGADNYETVCSKAGSSMTMSQQGAGPLTFTVTPGGGTQTWSCRTRAANNLAISPWSNSVNAQAGLAIDDTDPVGTPDLHFEFNDLAGSPKTVTYDRNNNVPATAESGTFVGGSSLSELGGTSLASSATATINMNATAPATNQVTVSGLFKPPTSNSGTLQPFLTMGSFTFSYDNVRRLVTVREGTRTVSSYAYVYEPNTSWNYMISVEGSPSTSTTTVRMWIDGTIAIDTSGINYPAADTTFSGTAYSTGTLRVIGAHDEVKVWRSQFASAGATLAATEYQALKPSRTTFGSYGQGYVPLTPMNVYANTINGAGANINIATVLGSNVPDSAIKLAAVSVSGTATDTINHINVVKMRPQYSLDQSSSINMDAYQTASNANIVALNDNTMTVTADYSANLQLSVTGFYLPYPGVRQKFYNPINPTRIVDTRSYNSGKCPSQPGQDCYGAIGSPTGETRTVLARGGTTGIPANADSVVVNITVANFDQTSHGFVTLYPTGTPSSSSSINFKPGTQVANLSVVKLGADGTFTAFVAAYNSVNNTNYTQLVIDLVGWYANPATMTSGLVFHPAATPFRIADTRSWGGDCRAAGGPVPSTACVGLAASGSMMLHINGVGGIPSSGVVAVVLNTLAPSHLGSASGSGVLYPSDRLVNNAATNTSLSWQAGADRSTLVQPAVSTDLNGQASCYNVSNTCGYVTIRNYGPGDLYYVVDVQGWFLGQASKTKCAYFNSATGVCMGSSNPWG